MTEELSPPVAMRRPHKTKRLDRVFIDDYHWLRESEDPAVQAYLEAENAYTDASMRETEALLGQLYQEMIGRLKEDDSSVPYLEGGFQYFSRTEAGKSYRIHCRKKDHGDEQVILDLNQIAEGKEYTALGAFEVSPDQDILAYSVDHDGNEAYTLRFKVLSTGVHYEESLTKTADSVAWASDNQTVFYTVLDESSRPYRVYRHRLGRPQTEDVLIFEEKDQRFFLDVERSRSGGFLIMSSDSAVTSEAQFLAADTPLGEFQMIEPRRQGVEYFVEHHSDRFYILTNDQATNFRLMEAPLKNPVRAHWREVIGHSDEITLSGFIAFSKHLVIFERDGGLPHIRVLDLSEQGVGEGHRVAFDEATYDIWAGVNAEFNATTLRFGFTSLVTPNSVYDYDLKTRVRTLRKVQPVIGYVPKDYDSALIWARAEDGERVPISLLYRRDRARDQAGPLLLHGYGAYGSVYEPSFDQTWFSLVDRGFAVGIAHVRGGGELGRRWKDSGKLDRKRNTFTDFIACAEHLIAEGYTSASQLAIYGGSAGGMLIGAVLNMRPDLFGVAIADVPFVDVLNTMLDETIPLTATEWEEWGDPREAPAFETIEGYSPYDNVRAVAYPHLLVLAGLNDPRVKYWEPAKWVAKLRATKLGQSSLLFKTNMGAGHGGPSGRYAYYREVAFAFAFILSRLGLS